MKAVDITKWTATVIQLAGYCLTGPWNIYLFFTGIFLWFSVGVMWKDRAIMLVHVGAFVSLLAGLLRRALNPAPARRSSVLYWWA